VEKKLDVVLACMAFAALAAAQGTAPKDSPAGYPAHAELGKYTLAAEFMVHAVPAGDRGSLFAGDYLVVEVAWFGPKLDAMDIRSGQFQLRINGKTTLSPQTPGMVAASMKYPDWSERPTLTAAGGVGNTEVIYGPRPTPRFPGDPTGQVPSRPRAPEPENPGGQEKVALEPVEDQVKKAALPEGRYPPPLAGALFFPFRGKTKSIKSVELLYEGPAGKIVLKLPLGG